MEKKSYMKFTWVSGLFVKKKNYLIMFELKIVNLELGII